MRSFSSMENFFPRPYSYEIKMKRMHKKGNMCAHRKGYTVCLFPIKYKIKKTYIESKNLPFMSVCLGKTCVCEWWEKGKGPKSIMVRYLIGQNGREPPFGLNISTIHYIFDPFFLKKRRENIKQKIQAKEKSVFRKLLPFIVVLIRDWLLG